MDREARSVFDWALQIDFPLPVIAGLMTIAIDRLVVEK